jgi:hypothetical protein
MAQFSRSELILSNDTSFDSSNGSETAASDGKHIARHNKHCSFAPITKIQNLL